MQSTSLVAAAHYRFDEASGPQLRDSINNFFPLLEERAGTLFLRPGAASDANPAIELDGGFLFAGSSFRFQGNAPFSIEVWVAPKTATDMAVVVRAATVSASNDDGYSLWVGPGRGIQFQRRVPDASPHSIQRPTPPPLGRYTHIVASYDGSSMRLYADGEVAAPPVAAALALRDRAATFRVGTDSQGINIYRGRLDELALYDYALPFDRARAHYLAATVR